LSWLLRNVEDIDSVVVDPRATKNHIVKSVLYLREHPEEARERAIPDRLTYQPLATLMPKLDQKKSFATPRHLRIFVDDDLVSATHAYRKKLEGTSEWVRFWRKATRKARDAEPLVYRENPTDQDDQITEAADALKTILSTKLMVGFHPDQATGACIDLAKELGIPFCIVPCCVFPAEFPHRRLVDGTRVRCYSQLLAYLKAKSPSIKTAALNFNFTETAKNLALYTAPTSFDQSST
jgi:hypothetical protein